MRRDSPVKLYDSDAKVAGDGLSPGASAQSRYAAIDCNDYGGSGMKRNLKLVLFYLLLTTTFLPGACSSLHLVDATNQDLRPTPNPDSDLQPTSTSIPSSTFTSSSSATPTQTFTPEASLLSLLLESGAVDPSKEYERCRSTTPNRDSEELHCLLRQSFLQKCPSLNMESIMSINSNI